MTDSRRGEKRLRELEFNDLNIHLYLTLNYGTASEHLNLDSMVLYNAFVLSWGSTITQNSIHTLSDLDRSPLSDTRSAENDRIGADTDPEYRIDASLRKRDVLGSMKCHFVCILCFQALVMSYKSFFSWIYAEITCVIGPYGVLKGTLVCSAIVEIFFPPDRISPISCD